MEEIRIIEVKQSVFADNNADAERLRRQLKEEKTFLLNLMSSPGAGKTTFLRKLAEELKIRFADTGRWGIEVLYDGVHFSPEGHQVFAKQLDKLL